MSDVALLSNVRLSRRVRSRVRRAVDIPAAEAGAPAIDAALEPEPVENAEPPLPVAAEIAQRVIAADEDPPFDPPDVEDVLSESACPAEDPIGRAERVGEELLLVPGGKERRGQYKPPVNSALKPKERPEPTLTEPPAPPISVFISWDRPDVRENQLAAFAAHTHLARATIEMERGGLDGALAHCAAHGAPDLLILDTTLGAPEMLAGLDRLLPTLPRKTKVIVVGAVNDVALLRGLAARRVSDYIVPPCRKTDLVRAACRLFAETDTSRVIAVMGASGGVGASTIAQNMAWSIAERLSVQTSLIDLDLAFGAGGLALAESALATTPSEHALFVDLKTRSPRLNVLAPANALNDDDTLTPEAVDALIRAARRASALVVLDLPHAWTPATKQAVLAADELLVVTAPDLAGLRNCESILRTTREAKPRASISLAMSMSGVPSRPEIPRKDFVEALDLEPVAGFAFEPEAVGLASLKQQTVVETAPDGKWIAALDALAETLSGRKPPPRKAETKAAPAKADSPPPKPRKSARAAQPQPDLARYPFTFSEPAPEQASEAPDPAPAPAKPTLTLASAREAAERDAANVRALARRRANRRLVRMATAASLLVVAGSWCVQTWKQNAAAQPPREAELTLAPAAALAAPITAAAPATPAAPEPLPNALDAYSRAQSFIGDGATPPSFAEAVVWTERAARAGHCRAMHDMGVFYARGEGVARDDAHAYRWFRQAGEHGVADSQYNLGIIFQQGLGVEPSLREALTWFALAAQSGDRGAAERAATLEGVLPASQVEEARARAVTLTAAASASPACAEAAQTNSAAP